MSKPIVKIDDCGLIDYKIAWDRQTVYHQSLVEQKRNDPHDRRINNLLMLCEHTPVYTLGKSGKDDHLVWNKEERERQGVDFYKINRGGDITYHGPGQLVVYPIFDLDQFFRDVHKYVRSLEEAVIRTLLHFDIQGKRIEGYTGVWITDKDHARKICAIGVHLSRWVSMHGLAFNINPNLNHFKGIVPCGIVDDAKQVTSISKELDRTIMVEDVKEILLHHFEDVFGFKKIN